MPRASPPCPVRGCPNLIRFTRYCPERMQAWSGPPTASSQITSQRRWRELARKILDRDRYRWRIQYEGHLHGPSDCGGQGAARIAPVRSGIRPEEPACQPCNDHKLGLGPRVVARADSGRLTVWPTCDATPSLPASRD